ncbi:hypothetical protein BDAP_002200 [Binucleata daphniae]
MNKKNISIGLVITALTCTAGYGGYKVVKHINNERKSEKEDSDDKIVINNYRVDSKERKTNNNTKPNNTQTPPQTPPQSPPQTPTKSPPQTPTKSPPQTPTKTPKQSPPQTPPQTPTKSPPQTPTKTPKQSPPQTPTNSPKQSPLQTPTNSPTKSPPQTITQTQTPTNSPKQSPPKSPPKSPTQTPKQPQLLPKPLTIQPTNIVMEINSMLTKDFTKDYDKVVLQDDIFIMNDDDKQKTILLKKLISAYMYKALNNNYYYTLANALSNDRCLQYIRDTLKTQLNNREYVTRLIQKLICVYSTKNLKENVYITSEEINFLQDKTNARRNIEQSTNIKPRGLECFYVGNTCFMMTFLQVILSTRMYKQAIIDNRKKHPLLQALFNVINDYESKVYESWHDIKLNHMARLYHEFNNTLPEETLDEYKFTFGKQNISTILFDNCKIVKNNNKFIFQELFEMRCNAYNGSVYKIQLSQIDFRQNGINSLYEALKYYFTVEADNKYSFENVVFTKLPDVLEIKIYKSVYADSMDFLQEHASFGFCFTPRFFLNCNGQKVKYVFRAATKYIPDTDEIGNFKDGGHYLAITYYGNNYYLCDGPEVTKYNTDQEAYDDILPYGTVWIYERCND